MIGRPFRATPPRVFHYPYASYRCSASKLKFGLLLCGLISFISDSWSYFSVHRIGQVYRLKGPAEPLPRIDVSETAHQGGACGGQRTLDLVLSFKQEPKAWLDGASLPTAPCEVAARPLEDSFEIRLSYPVPSSAKKMELHFLPFVATQKFVIDHWIAAPDVKKPPKPKPKPVAPVPIKTTDEAPSAAIDALNLPNAFDDKSSWEKILGSAALALDFNSPELDRFREKEKERNLGIPEEALERRVLHVPYLDLPPLDTTLEFDEEKLEFAAFKVEGAEAESQNPEARDKAAAQDAMNFVLLLHQKGSDLKAREALSILEKSKHARFLPRTDPRWWALKGSIYMQIGRQLNDRQIVFNAIDIWRDGLRASNGWGGERQPYFEFMALETVRQLFKEKLYYAAATVLGWTRRYSWSSAAEERFAYLRGEAFYQIKLYDEAREIFEEYVELRKDIPVSNFSDRRLVSVAAYRLGDLEFRRNNYKAAIDNYTKAFVLGPRVRKFSFEGNWLPEDVRVFPHVLFNRSEAQLRLGREDAALRDLRAFHFVDPSHPDSGLIYYRIGDVLDSLGASESKVLGAWRECIFKVPNTLGGRLCLARKAAHEMARTAPARWPRLIADIEDAAKTEVGKNEGFSKDELEVYLNIILADAFIKVNQPYQALLRLDPLRNREVSRYLGAWYREYFMTSVVGYLRRLVDEGKHREVIKEYARRRTALFLEQSRHDALFYVATAYTRLGLLEDALETLDSGEKVRDRIGREKLRPFEPSPEEWNALRADIQVQMYVAKKGDADPGWIRILLGKIDDTKPENQRLWIRYLQAMNNPAEEATWWAKLESTSGLKWKEVAAYLSALKKAKDAKGAAELLERSVGAWFGDRQRVAAANPPPSSLILELFEARVERKNFDRALAVADFLLGTDDKILGDAVTKPMMAYKKGRLLTELGRKDEARLSFDQAVQTSPESVWGKLSAAARKDIRL